MAELLNVKNLTTYFYRTDGIVKAVDGISYSVNQGEILGIVGESGSGKSVSVLSLLRLLGQNGRIMNGEAVFDGKDLIKMSKNDLRKVRGKDIAMIFQDPMTSLNPTYRIGLQTSEPLVWHNMMDMVRAEDRAVELLDHVGIPEAKKRYKDYPYEFSGGMQQRVMIAMSLTCKPKLLIADEPTTALDVTIRSQILNLMQDMKKEYNMSIILITHDFGVSTNFCDKIIVMYAGMIMESAITKEFLTNVLHPYSAGLLQSTLDIDHEGDKLEPIPGNPPSLINPPAGCRFHPRCKYAKDICKKEAPGLEKTKKDHFVACHFVKGGKFCG